MSAPIEPRVTELSVPAGKGGRGQISLRLTRYRHRNAKRAVLLLHGASAASRTFEAPTWGPNGQRGLVDTLLGEGLDVWLLDWRGSFLVVRGATRAAGPEPFTLDHAAEHDIPAAVGKVREEIRDLPLSVVAHCLGSSALCMAIGGGHLDLEATGIDRLVLTTVGLFYVAPWDGWFKAQDHALERALIESPPWEILHCDVQKHPWPTALEDALARFPKTLMPALPPNHPFSRLTFMYGRPYLEGDVPEQIHSPEHPQRLLDQFGGIARTLFIHACQNMRRGFAAPFDDASWSYSLGTPAGGGALDPNGAGLYLHPERFLPARIQLLTGEHNMLWHRESVLVMRDWLRRAGNSAEAEILPGFGHQDLYWSRHAPESVYPRIAKGVR